MIHTSVKRTMRLPSLLLWWSVLLLLLVLLLLSPSHGFTLVTPSSRTKTHHAGTSRSSSFHHQPQQQVKQHQQYVAVASLSRSSVSSTLTTQLAAATTTDAATTTPAYQITITYCTGCKWGLRSFWMAQELLSTFRNDPALHSVTLVASRPPPGGVFRVTMTPVGVDGSGAETVVLWDRKEADGFPELKELKQIVRDKVAPSHFLGHSDTVDRQEEGAPAKETVLKWDSNDKTAAAPTTITTNLDRPASAVAPNVAIAYCTGCQWLMRAAYMAQELVATFGGSDTHLNSVTLIPQRPPTKGGSFVVAFDNDVVWDRFETGRFPKVTELKQLLRDRVDPDRGLGHVDGEAGGEANMSDEDAAEQRKFFGVA